MLVGVSKTGWESDGGKRVSEREDRELHQMDKQWLTRAFSTIPCVPPFHPDDLPPS